MDVSGSPAYELDRRVLRLLVSDVAELTDADLARPTPCDGWTVLDLLRHLNTEHSAIIDAAVPDGDPRVAFPGVVAAWLDFFARAPESVRVPTLGAELPTELVLATHVADMVVHRWDLAAALGRPTGTPEDVVVAARATADLVTAEGSPLVGTAYRAALPTTGSDTPEEQLLRTFGRDPGWTRVEGMARR